MSYATVEKRRANQRAWRAANREKTRAYHQRWREANREKSNDAARRFRDQRKAQGGRVITKKMVNGTQVSRLTNIPWVVIRKLIKEKILVPDAVSGHYIYFDESRLDEIRSIVAKHWVGSGGTDVPNASAIKLETIAELLTQLIQKVHDLSEKVLSRESVSSDSEGQWLTLGSCIELLTLRQLSNLIGEPYPRVYKLVIKGQLKPDAQTNMGFLFAPESVDRARQLLGRFTG